MTPTPTDKRLLITNDPITTKKIPYVLYYRKGQATASEWLVFNHESDNIRTVVERAKRHCEVMNYRFVQIRPLVVNLDSVEMKQNVSQGAAAGIAE